MKQYQLKSKNFPNETFAKYMTDSLEKAIEYFARLKKISKKDLLQIFIVTD